MLRKLWILERKVFRRVDFLPGLSPQCWVTPDYNGKLARVLRVGGFAISAGGFHNFIKQFEPKQSHRINSNYEGCCLRRVVGKVLDAIRWNDYVI